MKKTALVIGITGGFGSAATQALLNHGWLVRALHRKPERAQKLSPVQGDIDWVKGDALNVEDVVAAAKDCAAIIHGANPPGYKNWRGLAIPMLENSIAAAKQSGARLVFPGNVYNFGPDAGSEINETSPQNPLTRKGEIRVEMEQSIRSACEYGMKALILRAGDYFGPNAPGSWFTGAMIKPGKPISKIIYPGDHDVGHAWAFLPDMAETVALLLEHEGMLADLEVFHFRGHALSRGVEIAEAIQRITGTNLPISGLPWPFLYILAPFLETFREIIEMRYLWKVPLQLDNTKLRNLIGEEPHTPLDDAVRTSLEGMKCLGR